MATSLIQTRFDVGAESAELLRVHKICVFPWSDFCMSRITKEKSMFKTDESVKPLSDDKILGMSKFEAFVDNNLFVVQMMEILFGWLENIAGKGEYPNYQHFLLFPPCFQKTFQFIRMGISRVFMVNGINPTQREKLMKQ